MNTLLFVRYSIYKFIKTLTILFKLIDFEARKIVKEKKKRVAKLSNSVVLIKRQADEKMNPRRVVTKENICEKLLKQHNVSILPNQIKSDMIEIKSYGNFEFPVSLEEGKVNLKISIVAR